MACEASWALIADDVEDDAEDADDDDLEAAARALLNVSFIPKAWWSTVEMAIDDCCACGAAGSARLLVG